MGLSRYKEKRDFKKSPEPVGKKGKRAAELSFVVQRHDATRLHYDFRLEMEGVLKSWAVPKGPSMKAGDKRLAILVEDHPIEYGEFYGEIPAGNYGAGLVDIIDSGTYKAYKAPADADEQAWLLKQLEKGDLKVVLNGKHLKGAFALVRIREEGNEESKNWLLIKKNDDYDLPEFDIETIKPIKTSGKAKKSRSRERSGERNTAKAPPLKKVHNNKKDEVIKIGRKEVKITNLDKVYWPDQGITKGELINYYVNVSDYILPYLKDRPESLNRFPNGIKGPSFYHKDMDVEQLPAWAKTVKMYSKANGHEIDYLICNDLATLVYMANLGCIEINPWHSRYDNADYPDYMMLDLDPGDISFTSVVDTANVIKELCDELKIKAYCKTSGATGIHVYMPLGAKYDYDQVKTFAEILANVTHSRIPEVTTIERKVAKRGNKIYIDFLQNRKGQTIAAPYSVRPKPNATVSTPLLWEEVNHNLTPEMFTIHNMEDRLKSLGDLWKGISKNPINITQVLKKLEKLK